MTQTLTGATAKILLGNITIETTHIETLIFASICDLETQKAPVFPTPTGGAGTYSWSLSNAQFAAVVGVLKEEYVNYKSTGSSGMSQSYSLGSLNKSDSSSSSVSGAGSRVIDIAKAYAAMLSGVSFKRS